RAEAIAADLKQTRFEAMLSGQTLGIRLKPTHYEVTRWLDEGWRLRDAGAPFPNGVELILDRARETASFRDEEIPEIEGWPDVIFDPTGVVEETRLRLRGRDVDYDILISENGEVDLAVF
ncbi:MAG: GspH/FimT family protein, partial [Pseudomonadota bacterium]